MTRSFNPTFAGRPVTIFAVMSALANKHGAINLGQGFPDEDGPRVILETAARAILEKPNQYTPVLGVPALRQALARANKRFYDIDLDWETETLVACGATEALAAAFFAFLQPGDEAVLLAPVYDCYAPIIEAAGAKPRYVNLAPPNWSLSEQALAAAITPKTKLIALNSPHNPCGRVVPREELEIVARLAIKHDLLVVCDEVYEHLVFDGARHVPLMTLPGMRERCVRIGSAGKTFSLTGWRIGYASGPARLVAVMMKAHQYLAYTLPGHLQEAVALGLDLGDDYYDGFTAGMEEKRDIMRAGLLGAGFEVLPCDGTYFMNVDIRSVGGTDDMAFCEEITEKAKVAAVPLSAFYPPGTDFPRHFVRFCFCKKREVLDEASARLKRYFA